MKRFILSALIAAAAFQLYAAEFYESNILGMKLRLVPSAYDAETEYVLRIENEGGIEKRTLMQGSEEISVTEVVETGEGITETTVKSGITETAVRKDGIIVSESFLYEDGRTERIEYNYEGRRMLSRDVYADEELLYNEKYCYTDEGRILDVSRTYSDEENGSVLAFIFDGGRISGFWMNTGDVKNYIRFNEEGVIESSVYGEGIADQNRVYGYLPGGLTTETITDGEGGLINILVMDGQNRIIKNKLTDDEGTLIEKTDFIYKNELLTKIKVSKEMMLEEYEYEYDEDGDLIKESYYRNSIIVHQTEYKSEDEFKEYFFREGRAVLRIDYAGGERTDTVQLQE